MFTSPLPAGSVVSITYRGLTATNNTNYQRYMTNVRLNEKFKGALDGLEVGGSFNRIYDFVDTMTDGTLTQVFQSSPTGYGLVSDTVFGVDFQYKVPFQIAGPGSNPVLYGETAASKYTPDYENVAPVGDTAAVGGVKVAFNKVQVNLQYQSVGTDFFDGAPFRYYGNAPALFANYTGPFFPDFFGFGNNLGINQQFDNAFTHIGATEIGGPTSLNPNLTYVYPIFNPFKATGPEFYSAFAPNTAGPTLSLNAPITIGDITFTTRAQYSHLQELQPDAYGALTYGPAYTSNVRMQYDTWTLGTQFYLPVFGQKLNGSLSGSYETLKRNDLTPYQYVPWNPATQTQDPTAYAAALAAFGAAGSPVSFYPNYVNVRHITLSAAASLPLTRDLALGGTYSTQRYGGSDGTTATQNISERKDYYTGSLTYSIPRTNSSISFVARNYRYVDDVVPSFNYNENRQDLNFTVRF